MKKLVFLLLLTLQVFQSERIENLFYSHNNIPCEKCNRGQKVKVHCTRRWHISECVACEEGTYADRYSSSEVCEKCKDCSYTGQIIKTNCTPETNTECKCPLFTYFIMYRGRGYCETCRPPKKKGVESRACMESEIIVGRLGEELEFNFSLSGLRDEYNNYIAKRDGKKIIQNEIQIQDLKKESDIWFTNKMNFMTKIVFRDGKTTYGAGRLTEIFLNNDVFLVKKTKLQKEDAGIYWIEYHSISLGHKDLNIADKPTIIKGRFPLNPILKAEDNFSTIVQLECHSVSTSVGCCQLVNNFMWYKNGMRMTDLDPTLSQINVTVDHNGGNFVCLATDHLPCYLRLNTTNNYDVLNIEECDNVYDSKTFFVKFQHAPIEVQLEPDQREITVNKNEDLKVKCSAKCHPKCDVKWEKDFQGLKSSDLVKITKRGFGNDLKIVNISSSGEGFYSCLASNTHGEARKNFTLNVRETENNVLMPVETNIVIVAVSVTFVIVVVILVIIIIIMYKKYHKNKEKESSSEEGIYATIDELLPGTSGDNNSRNDRHDQIEPLPEQSRLIIDENSYETPVLPQGEPLPGSPRIYYSRNSGENEQQEELQYSVLACRTPNVYTKLTHKPCRCPQKLNWILNKKLDLK